MTKSPLNVASRSRLPRLLQRPPESSKIAHNLFSSSNFAPVTDDSTGSRKRKRLESLCLPSATQHSLAFTSPVVKIRDKPVSSGKDIKPTFQTGSALPLHASDCQNTEDASQPFQHPPQLFKDEKSILSRFGMGSRVSPSHVPGFTGLFRQHWKDFHVTELVPSLDEPFGAKAVPRGYDFSVPSYTEKSSCHASERNNDSTGPVDPSFFSVDVERRLKEIQSSDNPVSPMNHSVHVETDGTPDEEQKNAKRREKSCSIEEHFLQCVLHKQHVAHSNAVSLISQTLRIHPRAISVAGMKDYIGDTVQRIRLENVSPLSVLKANRTFKRKGVGITLSHFSYEKEPLCPGDLFGNHFKIVLREVRAPKSVIQDAVNGFVEHGFPNYYGSQRFSWFGGTEDAAFALLMHNPLIFAFRFLNYTEKSRSLRELLQRPSKYPHPVQDQYRRNVVRRLRRISINPADLDEHPFLCCPSFAEAYEGVAPPLNVKQNLVIRELWESYMDLSISSRRPTAQRLSSYLWNQALTLRLHHFGGSTVLLGDHCVPMHLRRLASNADVRSAINTEQKAMVTPETVDSFSIVDVVHPGFSFENIELPDNAVGEFYVQICQKYHLQWSARHSKGGLKDFMEPPRPIVRHPIHFRYEYLPDLEQLTLNFSLERGCYANVALTELMKLPVCAGSDQIQTVPTSDSLWDTLGTPDPGYVMGFQDVYPGYEDGLGFIRDTEEVPLAAGSEGKVWDHQGPFFLPKSKDPYVIAAKWGKQHLLRPMQRRELDITVEKKRLFEKSLGQTIPDGEVEGYAGHTVPLGPNANISRVRRSLEKRRRRYPGAPRSTPRFARKVVTSNAIKKRPEYYKLNKNSWNVMW